jgi:hypothetical protein
MNLQVHDLIAIIASGVLGGSPSSLIAPPFLFLPDNIPIVGRRRK